MIPANMSAVVPGFIKPFLLCNFLSNFKTDFRPFFVEIPPNFIIRFAASDTSIALFNPDFRIINVSG